MDRHALEVLDFPRVRRLLAEGARSPQGADRCLALEPAPTLADARAAQAELRALADLEPVLGPPPTGGMERIEPDLEAAGKEGTCLEVERFLAVRATLDTCHRVLEYLEDAAYEGSPWGAYAERMEPLHALADRFERTFGPRGEILDGASPTLQQLRADLRRLRERVLSTLQVVLRDAELEPAVQEDFITLRSGRYVIPLRTDFRGYLDGIVHDRSRSGATFFVEPLEVVELNNRLSLVKEEEEAEVRRILVELTGAIRHATPALRRNLEVVAHLDALGARLALARRLRAVAPVLEPEPVLDVRGARHPLLHVQPDVDVVPIDLRLGGEHRLLLITGANAGGKTVALKTVGLTVLLAHCGLFIPADEGSRVGWFGGVFADIGDEQDIDRHLSTFSAHVSRVKEILERAEPTSLVLLDELGTGTDPAEGVGLAMAVLEAFLDRGTLVVGTTHLAGLKAFAYARKDAQNAAVAFDPATGRPLYRIEYGRSGASNALEVAERLGLPEAVLERARTYVAGGGEPGGGLLGEIERARAQALEAAARAETLRRQWEEKVAEQQRLTDEARRERAEARAEAREEARALLERMRRDLRREIRRFARKQTGQQQVERLLQAAREEADRSLRPLETPAAGPVGPVAPGSRVFVPSLGRDGVVESLDEGERKAVVQVGGMRVTVGRHALREPVGREERASRPVAAVRVEADRGAPDVVVVGCTVEEALARVDKALSRALLAGVDGFRVVHGRGTGALRRAVNEYLDGVPHVRGLREEGGGAATWVDVE
ncbi:MAG: endonuclease MutS2 [Deferrisomatales bacterium]